MGCHASRARGIEKHRSASYRRSFFVCLALTASVPGATVCTSLQEEVHVSTASILLFIASAWLFILGLFQKPPANGKVLLGVVGMVVAAFLFVGAYHGSAASIRSGTSSAADAPLSEVCAAHAMTMVVVGAHWCGYCRKLDAETLAHPSVREAIKDDGFARIYEEDDPDGVEAFAVKGYPTTVFLDRSCREVHRTRGFRPSSAYLQEISAARAKIPR